MKKMMIMAALAFAMAAFAQEGAMSLADARAQIGAVVADSGKMGEVISQLSAEDQVSFLASVNEAISKQPGSGDQKAAAFLAANTAAMKNAKKGNLQALLAETFATVPTEALTVINERFAEDLFNRAADPANPISDEQFVQTAQDTMKVIMERVSQTDESAVRGTFAILTFLRASGGSPADLANTLTDALGSAEVKRVALDEWIPAAMAEGIDKTYEPMLGAADGGTAPDIDIVLDIANSESMTALFADLGGESATFGRAVVAPDPGMPESYDQPTGLNIVPRSIDQGKSRGDDKPDLEPEDDTYPYQRAW